MIMAEIRQKIISCSKGHYYDANRYDSCPYCSTGRFSPTIDPFAQLQDDGSQGDGGLSRTTDAGGEAPMDSRGSYNDHGSLGNYGNFAPTEAPPVRNRVAESMSRTQFVDSSTPAGAPVPVVGWLVAVEGPCRGTDYRIHTGYNYIGRVRRAGFRPMQRNRNYRWDGMPFCSVRTVSGNTSMRRRWRGSFRQQCRRRLAGTHEAMS